MPRKKKHIKKKLTNVSNSITRKILKNEDVVQYTKVSEASPKQQLSTASKKSVSFGKECVIFNAKKILSRLDNLNHVTTSGTSERTQSNKISKISKQDNNHGSPTNRSIHSHCDNGEVKRLYSPFNKFSMRRSGGKKPIMPSYQGQYSHVGLSPQEKTYLICSCQSRSTRYQDLKNLAIDAMKNHKIFSIDGRCNTVRKALLERGWVEKIPSNKMNLSKVRNGTISNKDDIHKELERILLSNFVEKCPPNFIWRVKDHPDPPDTTIDMFVDTTAVVNKLKVDATWTTKQGLCSSMKRDHWFYIENVAEVNGPRTYNSYNAGEKEGFLKDFQITACTSLLKWVLSMVANERPIFVETGKISMNVVVFAINRCKEYLFSKENKDIDRSFNTASNGQWVTFLKKYYNLISNNAVFVSDKDNKLPLYMNYAKFLLKEIYKYRPQLRCEGCHNIWIIKPPHCSRGRGIRMASTLNMITNLLEKTNAKYVIQKYIEEPLLIYDTKFDIRQYYLVTSTYPLVIWMYRDCYLKFSSQKYNLKNFHESIHLTNNAVQRKYKNGPNRHPDLPQNNMWDSDKYKQYLNKIGKEKAWDNIIYPGMKKCIVGIMLSCQDTLSVSKNRFELYGCDFILDKRYEPWLIEINSSPDLNPTTHVTAKICPAVVLDIVKVVIDHARNPKASTGKFECIYRQPMTLPRYGRAADLVVEGFALRPDYFYRGKLDLGSISNANIEEKSDTKTVLKKLKRGLEAGMDTDIMMEPDEDSFEMAKDAAGQNTESEYELSMDASAVNGQINELIDRIASDRSSGSRSKPDEMMAPTTKMVSDVSIFLNHVSKSETGINSFLAKTESHCNSENDIRAKRLFKFSELEDGSSEQESAFKFTEAIKRTSILADKSRNTPLYEDLLEATTKIVSFIDKKEREYFKDSIKLTKEL